MRGRGILCRNDGYTLIEVTACLLIAGLLAGMAAISLKGAASTLTARDVLMQIEHLDRHARSRAQATGRDHWIEMDLKENTVSLVDAIAGGPSVIQKSVLPNDCMLSVIIDGSSASSSILGMTEVVTESRFFLEQPTDRARLVFTPQGYSVSYAAGIHHKPTTEENWMVMAGMTGHAHSEKGGSSHATQRLMLLRQAGDDTR